MFAINQSLLVFLFQSSYGVKQRSMNLTKNAWCLEQNILREGGWYGWRYHGSLLCHVISGYGIDYPG